MESRRSLSNLTAEAMGICPRISIAACHLNEISLFVNTLGQGPEIIITKVLDIMNEYDYFEGLKEEFRVIKAPNYALS